MHIYCENCLKTYREHVSKKNSPEEEDELEINLYFFTN